MPDILPPIAVHDLGIVRYQSSLQRQLDEHGRVVSGKSNGCVLLVQHTPVLTLGFKSSRKHILCQGWELDRRGIDVVRTERGGEVTAHNPGQLVLYPILPVVKRMLSPRKLVEGLEEAVIRLLSDYGIQGHRSAGLPGVWIGTRKICAVGIRISRRVSMHGIALNVDNDLSIFDHINPCGLEHGAVTSVAQQLKGEIETRKVKGDLISHVGMQLDLELVKS